jgi:hypothetical protein
VHVVQVSSCAFVKTSWVATVHYFVWRAARLMPK